MRAFQSIKESFGSPIKLNEILELVEICNLDGTRPSLNMPCCHFQGVWGFQGVWVENYDSPSIVLIAKYHNFIYVMLWCHNFIPM